MAINLRRSSRGFTIIEVLIVLAIAGLILLIVFLAVPALQRNSRNTQRKAEAARLLAASKEYVTNGGTWPSANISCNYTGGAAGNCDYTTTPIPEPARIWQLANLLDITRVTLRPNGVSGAMFPLVLERAVIQPGAVCLGSPGAASHTIDINKSPSIFVMVYGIENSDGSVSAQCLDG